MYLQLFESYTMYSYSLNSCYFDRFHSIIIHSSIFWKISFKGTKELDCDGLAYDENSNSIPSLFRQITLEMHCYSSKLRARSNLGNFVYIRRL